jgi:putative transposase
MTSRGMLAEHCLDAAWGSFLDILKWVSWKRGVYFAKVNPNGTSQTCPQCGAHTGKKELSERVHHCSECGYTTDRDVAAAQVVEQRGLVFVADGQSVILPAEEGCLGTPFLEAGNLKSGLGKPALYPLRAKHGLRQRMSVGRMSQSPCNNTEAKSS